MSPENPTLVANACHKHSIFTSCRSLLVLILVFSVLGGASPLLATAPERYDINNYGGDPTGTSDNSTAVALALAAMTASYPSVGGELYFPSGKYLFTNQFFVSVPNVTVRGEGIGNTIILRGPALEQPMINFSQVNGRIENLTVDGNGSIYTGSDPNKEIQLAQTGAEVHSVEVKNYKARAIGVYKSAQITNCIITGMAMASVPSTGIWMDATTVDGVVIKENIISDNGTNAIFAGGKNVIIDGNAIRGNHRQAAPTGGGQIDLQADTTAIQGAIISNNTITDGGGDHTLGIEVDQGDVLISGNVISNNAEGGISLARTDRTPPAPASSATKVVIIGNTVKNNGSATNNSNGIQVRSDVGSFQIIGNKCFDNRLTKYQIYGIEISAPTASGSDYYIISGNDLSGNIKPIGLNDLADGANKTIFGNLPGTSGAPTFRVGPSAGAGASVSIDPKSSDLRGQFTITTGTSPIVGRVATLLFAFPYTDAPFPLITAANSNASTHIARVHVSATTLGVDIIADTTLSSATSYTFNYANLER